ncbi:MAG TPA: RdgB/HAM1 family non-canonical purine NTP pyrophosphatase [Chloroflexota bacterium]|jgi:XTP/dITP diphosphohydrolase|nr:RdgB/HAM1 family non-canonical purine NTP pyrophosphatase [Chloroflexota bacterium]
MTPFPIIMATTNTGKQAAFQRLLADLPIRLYSSQELGIRLEIDETGATFAENALLKARAFRDVARMAALADDSGLCVDALGGEPGLRSARFGGLHHSSEEQNRLLLDMMEHVLAQDRGAEFVSVIAFSDRKGREWTAEGRIRGVIAAEPRGTNGFGYDPVFLVPDLDLTFAEMTSDQKDPISHRGIAMKLARSHLENSVALLE